jgi:organic hydroperoxide reductase OsmC/OhrA
MSEHAADVVWKRGDHEFTYQKYSRDHEWRFDGGAVVQASASPAYLGGPANVDPEEAFVASLSSCHLLTFLALAAKEGLVVDEYEDHPVGTLGKDDEGRMAMLTVTLNPKITFSGADPPRDVLERLHHQSHEMCFIANSVTTDVNVVI